MKYTKKLLAFLLTLAMLLSLSVTAFAISGSGTDNNGTITIENTVTGETYSIYRIFDLESFDTEKDAYSYKVNSAWAGFFTAPAEGEEPTNGRKYVDIDANGYVTWKKDWPYPPDFAKDALAFARANEIDPAVASKTADDDNIPVAFTSLPLGYYLVDSSLGALCVLTTTNPNATVTEKNAYPTLIKEVWEDSRIYPEYSGWRERNDADGGDTVKFRAIITVQGTASGYVLHDIMDRGLTFVGVTDVRLLRKNADYEEVWEEGFFYNVERGHSYDDKSTFDVIFNENVIKALRSGDKIVVCYEAILNEYASTIRPQENKAYLSYRDHYDIRHDTEYYATDTYTWAIDIFKYTAENAEAANKTPLSGAKFALRRVAFVDGRYVDLYYYYNTTENSVSWHQLFDGQTVEEAAEQGQITEVTTDNYGSAYFSQLDSGEYELIETKAPDGYNKQVDTTRVRITESGEILQDGWKYVDRIEILNQSGIELPSTGGMGTTIFYMVGSVLLVGAAVLLITKKRVSAAE